MSFPSALQNMSGNLQQDDSTNGKGGQVSSASENLIEVKNIKKYFYSGLFSKKCLKAADGVSFCIARGQSMGLIGESGSGKSTLGRCILRLIEPSSGEVCFLGENILAMNGSLRGLRKHMQIIFQDADGCLNPRMKAIDLILEPLLVHKLITGQEIETAVELMKRVNLPADLLSRYPNELSGGQRQRIGIARAISVNPDFIVADEATASLDMLGQSQIIELFKELKSTRRISFLNISHNLSFIRQATDMVAVMYLGRLVEMGKTKDVFNTPAHPYTQSLLSSNSSLDSFGGKHKKWLTGKEFFSLKDPSHGCSFYLCCPLAKDVCRYESPVNQYVSDDHWIWCQL